jgi:hypothetical protein
MAIPRKLRGAVSAGWRKARALARELNRALAEPARPDFEAVTRERDESVFQPRKY